MTAGKFFSVLMTVLALALAIGCDASEETYYGAYSYKVDELLPGFFCNLAPTVKMNDWFMEMTRQTTYDSWSENYNAYLYRDNKFSEPFAGSDLLYEDTVFYCDFDFYNQGNRIGEFTGTITLTDIPDPLTKIHLENNFWSSKDWWYFCRKVGISSISGTSGSVNWSLPVYESFIPNKQSYFSLVVIPGDSLDPYEVAIPVPKVIKKAGENVGDLGSISIKGVKLSGTINITLNGEPVPYLEILAQDDGNRPLNRTALANPEPLDAPWSLTYQGVGSSIKIKFLIFVYDEFQTFLFDQYLDKIITVTNNQNVSDIILNVGDIEQ